MGLRLDAHVERQLPINGVLACGCLTPARAELTFFTHRQGIPELQATAHEQWSKHRAIAAFESRHEETGVGSRLAEGQFFFNLYHQVLGRPKPRARTNPVNSEP